MIRRSETAPFSSTTTSQTGAPVLHLKPRHVVAQLVRLQILARHDATERAVGVDDAKVAQLVEANPTVNMLGYSYMSVHGPEAAPSPPAAR